MIYTSAQSVTKYERRNDKDNEHSAFRSVIPLNHSHNEDASDLSQAHFTQNF